MSEEPTVWTARWRGGFATDVSGRGHHLRSDEPTSVGGEDSGPMPTELLTAGLASCFCLAVAWSATKRDIDLPEDLRVSVTAIRAGSEPRYGEYLIAVHSSLPEEQLRPLVESAKRFCWVTNTLASPPRISYAVHGGA